MSKGGAKWQDVPACDVERVCGYITDDGFISSYFRISREEVQAIRARIKKPAPPSEPEPSDKYAKNGPPLACDTGAQHKAACGSEQLKLACQKLFWKFALRHRLDLETARELQLRGYRP
jgi:hypothetical protein